MAFPDLGFLEALTHLYAKKESIALTGRCNHEVQILRTIGYNAYRLDESHKSPTVVLALGHLTQHSTFEGFAKQIPTATTKHVVLEVAQPGSSDDSTIHTYNLEHVVQHMELLGFTYSLHASVYINRRQHHPTDWHHIAVFASTKTQIHLHPIIRTLTNIEFHLKRLSKGLQVTKRYLSEGKHNKAKRKSRATTLLQIKQASRCIHLETQGSDQTVLATVNQGALKHVVVSPTHARRFAQTRQYEDAVIQLKDESLAMFKNVQNVQDDINAVKLPAKAKSAQLFMTTLFFADYAFLQPWIEHYRKMGVQYFLLYFNGPEIPEKVDEFCNNAADISLIGWNFSWWEKKHLKGKSNHHLAQPAQLVHAKLIMETQTQCKHLIACDLDEYIIGPKRLDSLINCKSEITFANLWAEASFSVTGPDWENIQVPVEWTPDPFNRTKALRATPSFRRIKIHRNQDLDNLHPEFVMFHFHKMTHGSLVGRTISDDNFIHLQNHNGHKAYRAWDNRI